VLVTLAPVGGGGCGVVLRRVREDLRGLVWGEVPRREVEQVQVPRPRKGQGRRHHRSPRSRQKGLGRRGGALNGRRGGDEEVVPARAGRAKSRWVTLR